MSAWGAAGYRAWSEKKGTMEKKINLFGNIAFMCKLENNIRCVDDKWAMGPHVILTSMLFYNL